MRKLDERSLEAAVYGGLMFGAGGGGLEEGLKLASLAAEVGPIALASLDELEDDDSIVIQTGVGAPGVQRRLTWMSDQARALELCLKALGQEHVVGVMPGHPSAHMIAAWLAARIAGSGTVVVDCAANGRGHPTVAMGGMGLVGDVKRVVTQVAVGGDPEFRGRVEIVAHGPMASGSSTLHAASASVGGSVAACRAPFSVGLCRRAGAVGAVSACIALGESMLSAFASGGSATIAAVLKFLSGEELGRGVVEATDVALKQAWDVGTIQIRAGERLLQLSVCNEFMCVESDGTRLATFPDLIVVLSPTTGLPLSAARLVRDDEVVVVAASRRNIALGAGVWDEAAYREVEALIGKDLVGHLAD